MAQLDTGVVDWEKDIKQYISVLLEMHIDLPKEKIVAE